MSEEPILSIFQATDPACFAHVIQFQGTVIGKDMAPYQCPKVVEFQCPPQARCKGCPSGASGEPLCVDVPITDPILLHLIDCNWFQQLGHLKRMAGIPSKCFAVSATVQSMQNVEVARV